MFKEYIAGTLSWVDTYTICEWKPTNLEISILPILGFTQSSLLTSHDNHASYMVMQRDACNEDSKKALLL